MPLRWFWFGGLLGSCLGFIVGFVWRFMEGRGGMQGTLLNQKDVLSVSVFLTSNPHNVNIVWPNIKLMLLHTSQNSFNKRTKVLSLKIDIFDLKMMVKSGLEFFYFEIQRAPSEIAVKLLGHSVQIFLQWAAATLKDLQTIFHHHF